MINFNIDIKQAQKNLNRYKLKLFILLFLFLCNFTFFIEKAFAISLFENKDIDTGHWEIVDSSAKECKNKVNAHLLPDGNVIIFRGGGIGFSENNIDIFDPKQKKL